MKVGESINKFKLKDGITITDIAKEVHGKGLRFTDGGKYINPNSAHHFSKTLIGDISVNIAFPNDLSKWDDYNYVLVLDEAFGQPYTPFYSDTPFTYLLNVIGLYNKFMNSFEFFERRK